MSKLTVKHNLAIEYPHLVLEWHPSKNGGLTPNNVTPMSHKKVWWQCSKAHEWESIVSNRTQHKRGCPYCVNQKVNDGNCLATMNPTLAKEWHPTKNGEVTPRDVTPGSSRKKFWWQCHKGHEWEAIVRSRSSGCGCPYCSNLKVCADNCLASVNPKLAKEWHPIKNGKLTPNDVTPSSGIKVWWICKKGHEYKASVDNRSKDRSCPFCTNKTSMMELRIYSELQYIFLDTRHREKIDKVECDIFIPSLKVGLEYDGVYWHKNKHEKDRSKNLFLEKKGIKLIRVREVGLDAISENDVVFDFKKKNYKQLINALLKKIEKLSVLSKNEQERVCSYLEMSGLANNTAFINLMDMLPLPLPGTSVSDQKPKLSGEWHPTKNGKLTPQDITPGSNRKVWWECTKGHEWEAIISDRSNGTNCPYCGNKKVCKDNCLATTNTTLAKEWHPTRNGDLTPDHVTQYSNRRVWWQCPKKHEWESAANNRSAGHGCPYCAGQRATEETSLAAQNPQLAKEWHPTKNGVVTPKDVMPGSNKTFWWQCHKMHEWEASISNRRKSGCPYCGNKKVCEDNCLATKNPGLAKEWNVARNGTLTPVNVVPGSHKNVWWICIKGHEWKANVVDRSSGNGCPYCSGRKVTNKTS